ncbi:hypothetical protein BG842_08575 [Haladaptatus sp. W1]|uniref:hypothetical protein n=1 Tax=Haladaptatus sp. W1 TaxID=1897478 RepID=UPI00084981ED|nr:hypothetical protein [Haladaptatus sp. W1]ODR79697.1 hypothetical protein BG842_08575 [Haladaptatus sp. W1]
MSADELRAPIIGLQCTLLAIFLVIVVPHTPWVLLAFLLVAVGTLFTVGWAVAPTNSDTR